MSDPDPDTDALADFYLNADLSITEIEGPAEFYDWEAEENMMHYDDWKYIGRSLAQDAADEAPADDFANELLEFEDPNDLKW